jgi:hypothetical protein
MLVGLLTMLRDMTYVVIGPTIRMQSEACLKLWCEPRLDRTGEVLRTDTVVDGLVQMTDARKLDTSSMSDGLFCGHAHEMLNAEIEIIWSGCVLKPWYVRVVKQNELLRIMPHTHSIPSATRPIRCTHLCVIIPMICPVSTRLPFLLLRFCDHLGFFSPTITRALRCCSPTNFRNSRSARSPPLATPGVQDPNVGSKGGHDA